MRHPRTSDNTYVSKTITGANAGRVGYACKICHAASVARARERQARARHSWTAALSVTVSDTIAEHYARRVAGRWGRPTRIRQHHAVEVVDVICARAGSPGPRRARAAGCRAPGRRR